MLEGDNISLLNNNSGYLTSFTETDPIFMAASTSLAYQPVGNYLTTSTGLTVANFATNTISQWYNNAGYLTSFTETDPIFMAASTSLPYQPVGSYLTSYTETDPIWIASSTDYLKVANAVSTYLSLANWYATSTQYLTTTTASSTYLRITDAANTYQPIGSYLTSYTETDPIFMLASTSLPYQPVGNYLTTSTGLTVSNFATNTISQWYNNAGYLTSFTETDPTFTGSFAYTITSSTNWDTAYSWGNHASVGYLTSFTETDPLSIHVGTTSVSSIIALPNLAITTAQISDFGSYLTVESDPLFMAASTSLVYLKVESDPIWLAASSSYLTVATATANFLTINNAASTYLTQANAVSTYQPIGSYLTTYNSSTALAVFSGVSSTNATTTNLVVSSITNSWLSTNASGLVVATTAPQALITAGTVNDYYRGDKTWAATSTLRLTKSQITDFGTYENPLTFTYPLQRTVDAISLAFGTTTSNTWAGTQTFGTVSSTALQVNGNATTTGNLSVGNFTINGENFTDLTGTGLVNTGGALTHSTANGYSHIPATGASAQLLQYTSAGTAKWITLSGQASIADGGVLTVSDMTCTNCLNATEIEDIYVLNTSDTMSGSLAVGTTLSAGTSTLTNLIVTNLTTSTFAGGLTVGTSKFVVQQATGYIGMGIASPNTILHVSSSIALTRPGANPGQIAAVEIGPHAPSGVVGGGSSLFINTPGYNTFSSGLGIDGAFSSLTSLIRLHAYGVKSTNYLSNMAFYTTNGTSETEVMRLNSNGNIGIGTSTPAQRLDVWGNFQVSTGTTPALFVDTATREVGIGTSAPLGSLHVYSPALAGNSPLTYSGFNGSGKEGLIINSYYGPASSYVGYTDFVALRYSAGGVGGSEFRFFTQPSTSGDPLERMSITSAGQVIIGSSTYATTSNKYSLILPSSGVNTGYGIAVGWDTFSDNRIKDNQQPLNYGLKEILALTPKRYLQRASEFKNGQLVLGEGAEKIGLIAQEVYGIVPEAVTAPGDESQELWTMNYDSLIPVIIKSIQELAAQTETLKSPTVSGSGTSTDPVLVVNNDPSSGDVAVRNVIVNGWLNIEGDTTFYKSITVIGEAGFKSKVMFEKEVEFKDHVSFDQDTAGTATVIAGATSTEVVFGRPYEMIPRIVANLSEGDESTFANYKIIKKSTSSFTILLQNTVAEDLTFDWIALASKDREGQVAGVQAIAGCMDSTALNYNNLATENDGSCTYETITPPVEPPPVASPVEPPPTEPVPPAPVLGCMDSAATNYDQLATQDNGTCTYEPVVPATEPPVTPPVEPPPTEPAPTEPPPT